MHAEHKEIVSRIRFCAGSAKKDEFLENYLGNAHPRYPISNPDLRVILRDWMNAHKTLPANELVKVLSSLVEGKTFTEKIAAGMMLDYARPDQRRFDIRVFDRWLDHLEGWAEVDTLCTGKYTRLDVPVRWDSWAKLVLKLNRSKNVHKRRASLVLLCSPLSHVKDETIRIVALGLIDRVKHEKHILITKAISWLLRSMIRHHRDAVNDYLDENVDSLPSIAIRETRTKLETGRKVG